MKNKSRWLKIEQTKSHELMSFNGALDLTSGIAYNREWPNTVEGNARQSEIKENRKVLLSRLPWIKCASQLAKDSPLHWSNQSAWGYTIFDFWNAELGLALAAYELPTDGSDVARELAIDRYQLFRSGIVVMRYEFGNSQDFERKLKRIEHVPGTVKDRQLASAECLYGSPLYQ